MKYLAILFLSFAFVSPALAAKTVTGTVPDVQPLQPAPVGVFPNYSKNIQSQGPFVNDGVIANSNTEPSPRPAQSFLSSPITGASHWAVWLAAILAAGVFGLLFYIRNKPE